VADRLFQAGAISSRGYFNIEDIEACEQAGYGLPRQFTRFQLSAGKDPNA
jgi:hypothetical protein